MKVSKAVAFWLEYHKANSKKKIRVKSIVGLTLIHLSFQIHFGYVRMFEVLILTELVE